MRRISQFVKVELQLIHYESKRRLVMTNIYIYIRFGHDENCKHQISDAEFSTKSCRISSSISYLTTTEMQFRH